MKFTELITSLGGSIIASSTTLAILDITKTTVSWEYALIAFSIGSLLLCIGERFDKGFSSCSRRDGVL